MTTAPSPSQATPTFRSTRDYLDYHGWFLGTEYEGTGLMAVAAISSYRGKIPQTVVNAAAAHENTRIKLAILGRADVTIPPALLHQALNSVQPAIQIAAIARADTPLDALEYLNMVSVERDPAVALALLARQSGVGTPNDHHEDLLQPVAYITSSEAARRTVESRQDVPVE